MPLTDQDLIARVVIDDDRHAFGELVRRHQSDVRTLLRRVTGGDASLADDLAQETFVKAWRNLSGFRGGAKFSTWLYRIAWNTWLSAARTKGLSLDPAAPDEPDVPASSMPEAAHLKRDLEAALVQLRPEERAAIAVAYAQGATHEEAAEILGWPVGTVKSLVLRGKGHLRELLSAWNPEGDS